MFRIGLFGLLSGLATAGLALAADVKGSKDHPLVGRYEGSDIVGYRLTDYDQVRVVQAPFDPVQADARTGPAFLTVEGRSFLIYYRLPEGRSTLEVLRNYEASLGAKGFTTVFECATTDGTCFQSQAPDAAYYLGTAIGPPLTLPKLDDDYVHNWFDQGGRYLLARLDQAQGPVYASIALGEGSRGAVAVVRVIEPKAMDTDKIVFIDAGQMATAIANKGRVTLDGIRFDFDQDTLRPESKPTVEEVAKLLKNKPELRLSVIGHTDNLGTAEHNQDLSSRRAARVVATLTKEYGVRPSRLSYSGVGSAAQVANNASEDGRARNRRVELVAQ
jgi:OOP family OmpA-OmpF porin